MRKILFVLVIVASNCFSLPLTDFFQEKYALVLGELASLIKTNPSSVTTDASLDDIKKMLYQPDTALNAPVIDKILTTISCANQYKVDRNTILTVIDYSRPSSEKRLWVFDLKDKKMLFHTYVSHGIRSGALSSHYFSNKNNSKASSIGVYTTEKTYYGRDGLSLRLDGLDRGFNDNASMRYVVIHGGWYVDEPFIKKYGRAGRSWGCPALPLNLAQPIINTIKDKSLMVIYYPSDAWLLKSKFLHCNSQEAPQSIASVDLSNPPDDAREDILFIDLNRNNKHEENEPIVVITAEQYQQFFHTTVPLERMLRRQINEVEYIALTNNEFIRFSADKTSFANIHFIVPVIKMIRGYYETQMSMVPVGKLQEVKPVTNSFNNQQPVSYNLLFENKQVSLKSTGQFIRWLGL